MPAPDETPKPAAGHGRTPHRTWPERLTIAGTFAAALMCFVVAAALVGGYLVARQRNIADFQNPADVAAAQALDPPVLASAPAPDTVEFLEPTTTVAAPADTSTDAVTIPTNDSAQTSTTAPTPTPTTAPTITSTTNAPSLAPPATFPDADPEASNFLITGADNGACIDPDSPYAGTFGDREEMGERSDTIMVLRVDPSSKRVAILSFPRDLYVEIAGNGNMSRINSAYQRNEPQRLADTIFGNFDIPIDHFIQVDFCAFKTLVDAVGGVAVPFEFPARDPNSGLDVPDTGCFTFDGEHGLAYVRSRYYEYEDAPGSGNWSTDPTSDLGRISRQQDFLRRTLTSLLDTGPLNPRVARGLIRATTEYITTDRNLTPSKMLEFAGVMNDVQPDSIVTYQIEATARTIGGADVLIPNTDGQNMQAVLSIFRGETSLADAPEQVFEQTTTALPRGATTTETTDADPATVEEAQTADAAIDSTVVEDAPEQNRFGIVPPRDETC